jgi:hypothetical protein
MLWELFGGASEGFFIEAGAFDGYHYSVTYPFEAVGWNGLLVEAAPEPAERCARLRRYSKVHHNVLARRGAGGEVGVTVVGPWDLLFLH